MPAHAISRRRERRFLALVEAGASISEASRAVEISRQTIHRRVRADPTFAVLLRSARDRKRSSADDPFAQFDWRVVAELPEPFDFDPLA